MPFYRLKGYRRGLQWKHATSPVTPSGDCSDQRYRDGKKAVANAKRACALTNERDWVCIDVLAMAYAEDGQFAKAVEWPLKAIELATTNADKQDARSRLELYKQKKPFREEANKKWRTSPPPHSPTPSPPTIPTR